MPEAKMSSTTFLGIFKDLSGHAPKCAGLSRLWGQGSFLKSSLYQSLQTQASAPYHRELLIKTCPRRHIYNVLWSNFLRTRKPLGSSLPSQGQKGCREGWNPSSWPTEPVATLSHRPQDTPVCSSWADGLQEDRQAQSNNASEHSGLPPHRP